MDFSAVLALLLTVLITLHIVKSYWRRHRRTRLLPPGPTPLPVLGTPKYMNQHAADKNFTLLSKKYGSIFTIWNLSEPVVVLCGYETVRDALLDHAEEFSARPFIPTLHIASKGYGINGSRWHPLRSFVSATLKIPGLGKKTMESRVLDEATCLIRAMAETERKPFNPLLCLASAVVNIISSILFAEHFDYKDPKLHELMTCISLHSRSISSPLHGLCNAFPFLLKMPLLRRLVFKENTFLKNFVQRYIEEHKRTLKPEAPRDFIDHFLLKMKEVEHEEDPDFCDHSLTSLMVVMLASGTEATSNTLTFSLFFLAHFPDVQAKVQQEIDEVTKSMRPPTIKDRPHLAYTNAVIHEIQRVLDLAPIAFFHAVTKDLQFHGYTIPKGTMIIPFLTSVLTDPSQWETPEQFNPGHFLDEEGKFHNRVAFMPFSAGKRVCVGETLARMMLFLLLSALLQKFTFKLAPGAERRDSKWLFANKLDVMFNAELCAVPRTRTKSLHR